MADRVPNQNQRGELFEAIREHLSPDAVATIAAWLQPARTNDTDVNGEVAWFRDALVEMLGTVNYNRACEELGL